MHKARLANATKMVGGFCEQAMAESNWRVAFLGNRVDECNGDVTPTTALASGLAAHSTIFQNINSLRNAVNFVR
jgi:pullulanase/glycogen debranching enzyme